MKILDALFSSLNTAAEVRDIRQGPFQTAVLTRHCGLASTPHDPGPHHSRFAVGEAGRLLEKSARELAGLARSENLHEAAIGMAAINSLLKIDETRCRRLNARDLIAEKGRDRRIAIIGHFPFVPKIREIAKELWVIEKNPHQGDHPESEATDLIPEADVVAITGMAFTNHTIEPLLELCDPAAYVIILGDTSPLSSVLFDYGVDAVSGTKVIDHESALRCVSQGATYRQIKGIQQLTMIKA
jgi:uncharacterized protein (DUF4213/DUF364 family)